MGPMLAPWTLLSGIVSVRVPANEIGRGYSNAKCVPIRPGFPTIIKKAKQKQNKQKTSMTQFT